MKARPVPIEIPRLRRVSVNGLILVGRQPIAVSIPSEPEVVVHVSGLVAVPGVSEGVSIMQILFLQVSFGPQLLDIYEVVFVTGSYILHWSPDGLPWSQQASREEAGSIQVPLRFPNFSQLNPEGQVIPPISMIWLPLAFTHS